MSLAIELATHLGALVGGILLHAFVAPPLHRKIEEIKARHARTRMHERQLPDPPRGFNMYALGNLRLPVMSLFGTPTEPLRMDEVLILILTPGLPMRHKTIRKLSATRSRAY